MSTIYHLEHQFTKIKVSDYQRRLIIIDYLTHLYFFFKQFKVSIVLSFYQSCVLEALFEMKKENDKTTTKFTTKCLQYE